ncbi:hypothetical protein Pfra02_04420 [Pseudomonas fragi]|nr:hypothetical protein Pfra02_04420 [Pseudomonas fragi]
MFKRLIPAVVALMMALPVVAAPSQQNAAFLSGFFAQRLEGAYTDGSDMIYVGYINGMVLIIGGEAVDTEITGVNLENNSVTFNVDRGDGAEQVTLQRSRNRGLLTMGSGTVIPLNYVRALTNADVEVIKRARSVAKSASVETDPGEAYNSKPAAFQ